MIFHINATMPEQKSGIEHAEIQRFMLFKKNHITQKLVLRDWDPECHRQTIAAGIDDDDLINMFDYFQKTTIVATQLLTVKDLDFGVAGLVFNDEPQNARYLVVDNNQMLVARVNYVNSEKQRVKSVELFDGFGNLYRVDHYDVRGFKSLQQWYTPDNKIESETWLDVHGQPVLESFFKTTKAVNHQSELTRTNWHLTFNDKSYDFDTIEDLTIHFLDAINQTFFSASEPNIFILDRSHLADYGLLQLKNPAYTVLHLHNSHAGDAQEPMQSILNNNYEFAMNALDQYDAVVSATPQQTRDIQLRFQPNVPLFTIPVGIVKDTLLHAKHVSVGQRQFGKIVAFARIAWEKHLDDLVRAVGIVKQEIPEVSLDLYGYADTTDNFRAKRAVEAVIDKYHLADSVTMRGYTTNIDAVENQAMIYGLTSRMEGFNLAIMEGIAHGLIALTYDVNYGPNEIVQDNINGRIVPYGDYRAMADAIITVLRDPELAQRYSEGAYQSAERYSETNVMAAWQKLIDDANQKWQHKIAATNLGR